MEAWVGCALWAMPTLQKLYRTGLSMGMLSHSLFAQSIPQSILFV